MSHSAILIVTAVILGFMRFGAGEPVCAQEASSRAGLDARVSGFLEGSRRSWRDLNVPYEDGEILHNLVIKGNFKNILEIGTSTGHSTIWLAWAASKTGGKVTTIEIDKGRHESALANFRKAGVESYIDARLADAHELVPALKGPFDFVFCDADKEWYLQYFLDLAPKVSTNGCYTAHNVLWSGNPDIKRFLDQVRKDTRFRTSIERGSGEGISVSCRMAK
jgi:caffeoyl-CoA O-methyltransferase